MIHDEPGGLLRTIVAVLDTATNTVTATVPVGLSPFDLAVTPNGASVYVTNGNSGTVSVIDTTTNTVTATIPVFGSPTFVAVGRQDPIGSLINQIQALVADGTLTQNQGAGLLDKLNQVTAKLDANQTGAACNQLSSFISQVQAFINSHALTPAQGQSLIDGANALRTSLGCS